MLGESISKVGERIRSLVSCRDIISLCPRPRRGRRCIVWAVIQNIPDPGGVAHQECVRSYCEKCWPPNPPVLLNNLDIQVISIAKSSGFLHGVLNALYEVQVNVDEGKPRMHEWISLKVLKI